MAHNLTSTLSVYFLFFLTTHTNNSLFSLQSSLSSFSQQQNYRWLAQQRATCSTPLDQICCTDNRICLLLYRRLLHFTSIGSAFPVGTDKTREAMSHRRNPLPLDPREAIHGCSSNETETEIHDTKSSKLTTFFNSISIYIYFL